MTFVDLELGHGLLDGLHAMGYRTPTPIQLQAIPHILAHRDLIAIAQTGTGKTGAYLLPILQHILHSDRSHIGALILVPTRELALQVDQQIEGLGYFTGISSIPVYGGGDGAVWEQQKRALQSQADIVVATPGRLISHLTSEIARFDRLRHVVLDEADRMLDMGFYEDIVKIISHLPTERQTLMFSATMPGKIRTLANAILRSPVEIAIAMAKPADNITQQAYMVSDNQKRELLAHILGGKEYASVIVFTSTKSNAKRLESVLRRRGLHVRAFHSDLEQPDRKRLLDEFKAGQVPILVGTDILSRGIDVEGIDLVVNFDVPSDPEDYVHRVGRTARADRKGVAITLINAEDRRKSQNIERLIGKEIPRVELPAGFSEEQQASPQQSGHRRKPPGQRAPRRKA